MEEKFSFGKRLKEYREAKGLSQAEFGKLIEKSMTSVYGYEKNQMIPTFDVLCKMTTVLGVEIEDLLGLERGAIEDDMELYMVFAKRFQERRR